MNSRRICCLIAKHHGKLYKSVREVSGPLLAIEKVEGVGYEEIARIIGADGKERVGRVIEVGKGYAIVQVLGEEEGLSTDAVVKFVGTTFGIRVSEEVLGRMFNGRYEPIDGMPPVITGEMMDVNGLPINPYAREYPHDFIQTGVSVIDGLFSLVRGQKLPIFSVSGLPHNALAAQIARQATVIGKEEFAVVFAGIGLRRAEMMHFMEEFRSSGALKRLVAILNLAEDPVAERLLTPRIALTVAEYLAFELELHTLVIMTDMTNYCEALREVSAARGEVPGRYGYPGYMYTDLATIYERAGLIKGKKGSLTLVPMLTMPGGDLRHPIPDLTGYITEGQVILSPSLHARGIYPPVDVLPSLSRLMKAGVGAGKTREDHMPVADQLYSAYARGVKARDMARIVGELGLSPASRKYLEFADVFESRFINQGYYENRDVEETLDLAWEVLSVLPEEELVRIPRPHIEKYYPKHGRVGK
jgi:V/A-type H+-transporting ATPase subunit B